MTWQWRENYIEALINLMGKSRAILA